MDYKAGANLSLKLQPTEVDFAGSGKSSFSVSPTSVRKAYIVKKGQWKIDMTHTFIKEFSDSTRRQLYVVIEAFEIKEPMLIEKMNQGEGKVQITTGEICGIQGRGKSFKKKMMLIPQGTVLAYVVQPLNTQKEGDFCGHKFVHNRKPSFVYDGFKDESESSQTAFQKAKGTIKEECEQLMYLNQDLRLKLLGTFESFLQDGDVISAVKTVLELSLAGGQPKHSMLELLDDILRPQVENLLHDLGVFSEGGREEALSLWQPVHFLCSSLEDLDFRMLPLLLACLEKNMVAKQFELMDGILQWILSSDKESIFSLACSLTEEEKNIVAEMLFTCGLIPQTDRPSLTYLWNEAAQSNLTALYATLYALRILSE
ncbi:gasdermin-D-like [Emydura macquarii macquarii]|uniref:gasdermin-D-like n=1 Tax=Emydura macquarii macquarii TaxID=1129001 RepID=UPI00352BBB30